jgi:hypothetical protein
MIYFIWAFESSKVAAFVDTVDKVFPYPCTNDSITSNEIFSYIRPLLSPRSSEDDTGVS